MTQLTGNILTIPRTGLECCYLLIALIHRYNSLVYQDFFEMSQRLSVKLEMFSSTKSCCYGTESSRSRLLNTSINREWPDYTSVILYFGIHF